MINLMLFVAGISKEALETFRKRIWGWTIFDIKREKEILSDFKENLL